MAGYVGKVWTAGYGGIIHPGKWKRRLNVLQLPGEKANGFLNLEQ